MVHMHTRLSAGVCMRHVAYVKFANPSVSLLRTLLRSVIATKRLRCFFAGRRVAPNPGPRRYPHSLLKLCQELQINGEVERAAQKLDFYYVGARDPNAFPEGAPHKMFRHEDAIEAHAWAELILKKVIEAW